MGNDGETTIKIIEFNGNKKSYLMWKEKYLARAKRKNHKELLTGKYKVPTAKELESAKKEEKIIEQW